MRKVIFSLLLAGICTPLGAERAAEGEDMRQTVRFVPLAIRIDPAGRPLAAYQFEIKAAVGTVRIVGVEGGEHPAFSQAPYYDPAALAHDRIIIAAFSTDQDLPTTRTRVATVHLQVVGDVDPQYELNLTVAADGDGNPIEADITCE